MNFSVCTTLRFAYFVTIRYGRLPLKTIPGFLTLSMRKTYFQERRRLGERWCTCTNLGFLHLIIR